jgi:hypothetical protein
MYLFFHLDHDSHSWVHRCFPPMPSVSVFCGAESNTERGSKPCFDLTPLEEVKPSNEH